METISSKPKGDLHYKTDLADNFVMRGKRGIYRNKKITQSIIPNDDGITIAMRHTDGKYDDLLTSENLIYRYPETDMKNHDEGEIKSTKACMIYNMPIFIILKGNSRSTKEVKIAWVVDFDDLNKIFFLEFLPPSSTSSIPTKTSTTRAPFNLTGKVSTKIKSTVSVRPE